MKIITLFLMSLFLGMNAHATEIRSCEEWRTKLPKEYASMIRSEKDAPSTLSGLALTCGKSMGGVVISSLKAQGVNAVIFQITARLGVSAAATSLLMVGTGHVYTAYQASKLFWNALERDKECYMNHELKRSFVEPVAHFYSADHLNNMVQNWPCGEIIRQTHAKVMVVEREIALRQSKQAELDAILRGGHAMSAEMIERRFPAALRTLSPEQVVFLDKKARLNRGASLMSAAGELLACLKPAAATKLACEIVGEVANTYFEPKPKHKTMNSKILEILVGRAEGMILQSVQ